jgi:hypothetical protein
MSVTRFPFKQQWGHVGSEIGRAIGRKTLHDTESYKKALERAMDMLDEMISVHTGFHNLKELTRFREFLAGIFVGSSEVNITLEELERYCNRFVGI